ncbi:MAG: hypothetical protein K8T90_05470 [Planctomycetes bacterium]|nr:hypothetical protein [Planctomycetota bacterium]
MSVERTFVGNAGVKLLALLLAWGLWFAVREDLDEVREARPRVVVIAAAGSGIEGESLVPRVSVKLKGPRHELDLFENTDRALVLPVRADDLTADQHSGTKVFTAEDILVPEPIRPGTVRVIEVEPDPVQVRLWRVERRDVPLAPPEFPGIEDLGVQVERRRWPQKAVVRAPTDQLGGLLVLKTGVDRDQLRRFVEAMGDAPRTTVTLPLSVIDTPTERLTIAEPTRLEVTADLVRNAEITVTLRLDVFDAAPVGGSGAPGGASGTDSGAFARSVTVMDPQKPWFVAGDPPKVNLALRGNPRSLASLGSAPAGGATALPVRVYVTTADLPAGASRGEVRVHASDLPPGVALANGDLTLTLEVSR